MPFGAFVDINAETDALVHISEVANRFVADVKDVLKEGQKIEPRLLDVDFEKRRVALSLKSDDDIDGGGGGGKGKSQGALPWIGAMQTNADA